jgi:hypothetical protein
MVATGTGVAVAVVAVTMRTGDMVKIALVKFGMKEDRSTINRMMNSPLRGALINSLRVSMSFDCLEGHGKNF